jgi:hypothetical protein
MKLYHTPQANSVYKSRRFFHLIFIEKNFKVFNSLYSKELEETSENRGTWHGICMYNLEVV